MINMKKCYNKTIKAIPHKNHAKDETNFFVRLYRKFSGILAYVKKFPCNITKKRLSDLAQSLCGGALKQVLIRTIPDSTDILFYLWHN